MTEPIFADCENCGRDELLDYNTSLCNPCWRAFQKGYKSYDFTMNEKIAAFRERERILKLLNERMHKSEFSSGICNCYECTEIRAIIQLLTAIKETV